MRPYSIFSWITLKATVTILFYLICLLMTIDTGLFVYPSLSRMLLMMIVVLVLSVITFSILLIKNRKAILNLPTAFVVFWLIYVVISGYSHGEVYRTLFLYACLISIITFAHLFRSGLLSEQCVSNGVIGIAIIHITYMLLQHTGFIASENAFFRVTGSNGNPTTTALFLTGSIPFLIARMRAGRNRSYYVFLLISMLLCIISLQCRTAYIGGIVIFAYYLLTNQHLQSRVLPIFKRNIFFSVIVILVVGTAGAYKIYSMKQDSADGRILIWRLSAEMMKEKPLGYGYGMFEKYYNLKQAEYFSDFCGKRQERDNAAHVSMAYNDYLEQGVEGGIPGVIFLVGFYVLFMVLSVRHKLRDITPVIMSFSVMSLTNFVIQGIQPWVMICLCSGIILCRDLSAPKYTAVRFKGLIPYTIIILVSVAIMVKTFQLISSQYVLFGIVSRMNDNKTINDSEFAEIEKGISTSEAFWFYRAKHSMRHGSYAEASKHLNKALEYSSSPDKFFLMYRICSKQNAEYKGVMYLSCVSDINPCHLYPKYLLMKYYDRHSDTAKARLYADDILKTRVKNPSKKSQSIQYEAHQYLRNH